MFMSPPRNTFRYTFSWLIVAALVFVPLLLWAAYNFYQSRQVDPVLASFTAMLGLSFAYAWWWTKTRVTVHDEGICYKSPFREKDLRWEEITETRYGQRPINAGAHFGLVGWLLAAIAGSNNKMIRSFEIDRPAENDYQFEHSRCGGSRTADPGGCQPPAASGCRAHSQLRRNCVFWENFAVACRCYLEIERTYSLRGTYEMQN